MTQQVKDAILYIDDETYNLQGFEFIMKKDYDLHVASSADEGLRMLRIKPIKVVITDHRMPDMSGIDLLKILLVEFPEVIRIIVTAYSDTETILQAINQGKVYHFITKPWNNNELKVVIQRAVETYNLRKDNVKLIEHLQKVNLDLQLAKEKAEESDKLKTSFISNMSHEIRTPLNAIIGFTNLIISDTIDKKIRETFVNIIETNCAELLNIIEDILDTSKIEAGYLSLNESEFDLNKLMCDLYIQFQQNELLKDKTIKFEYNYPKVSDKLQIYSDQLRIKQMLSNLISNALKFTDEGTVEFGYEITQEVSCKYVELYVRDTGIGIPRDKFDYIFERFRKIENEKNRLFRGNGLGLFITRKLVELMGGNIKVNSEVNQGSEFRVKIPVKPSDSDVTIVERHSHSIETTGWPEKTILIVEDEDSNFMFMNALLNKKTNLVWVKNGQEAITACDELKIDLVLMDIQLPRMNGFDATRIIKKSNPNIPVIAVTAFAMDADRKRCIDAGCDNFIAKPFKKEELFSLINTYIQKK
jgi:signal transduction histidine kinase